MFQYYLYGLGIHTEIKLYDLDEQNVEKDVWIHYGKVPEEIREFTAKGLASTMSPDRVWFRNDIGHFIITGGNDILVEPMGDVSENDLASFVLGWCIAFLFQLRGASAIHCSAIEIEDQAVLIAGLSGAGKSTIALSFIEAGYRYLVDDIAMVDPGKDMMIEPAFPQQKVCRNIAEQMDDVELCYINEKKDKFAYHNTKDFCGEPKKVTTMFILEKDDSKQVRVEELTGIEKLNAVLKNLFLLDAYQAMGFTVEEKARSLEIAGKIRIYKITRPQDQDTVEEIRERILGLVTGEKKREV